MGYLMLKGSGGMSQLGLFEKVLINALSVHDSNTN
jgi:hypothetical protein